MTERDILAAMFAALKTQKPSPFQAVTFTADTDGTGELTLYTHTDEWIITTKDVRPVMGRWVPEAN